MTTNILEKKRIILKKLVNSGINISPSVLELILTTDSPFKNLDLIIRETSFNPTFKSHITVETLSKISNKEILKSLENINEKRESKKSSTTKIIKDIKVNKQKNEVKEQLQNKKLLSSPSLNQMNMEDTKSQISKRNVSNVVKTPTIPKITSEQSIQKKDDISLMINRMGAPKSKLIFNPIAKEIESNYKIKKDPTGKLFTSGEYNDFYTLTLDKYNRLSKLMSKRPETRSSINISNISRFKENTEISIIGLVKEINQTKNGHYFLTLEDLTGNINVLVKKDTEIRDNIKTAKRTINDQMLYVNGIFKPGEHGKNGIIFANIISKIDIPMGIEPKTSPDPLSLVLISDIHIGSREFEEKLWNKFIDFLKGNINNKKVRKQAEKIKYIIINGDLVDGIGVYPNQKEDLVIADIYDQYRKAAEIISEIPDYIQIFYSCGNHEPVRNAIPRPAVPKKYTQDLLDINVKVLGNPCVIQTHQVDSLVYHGDSLIDLNFLIPDLDNNKPAETMKELLICRHLAPAYGNKTQIAPTSKDWLVIDEIPQIFHTGHIHINDFNTYRGVKLINSGCFQSQTDFMRSFGIEPTPGIVPVIELDTLNYCEINLKKNH